MHRVVELATDPLAQKHDSHLQLDTKDSRDERHYQQKRVK